MSRRPFNKSAAARPAVARPDPVRTDPVRSAAAGARAGAATADDPSRAVWLTRLALGLAIAVAVARLMMTEAIRSAIPVGPGSPNVPAGPRPAAGLFLDLLAGLCPLLVLVRRWADPAYALRLAWSPLLFVALAGWAVASTVWAGDQFAALVSSCHLLAAAGVVWSVAQVVRTAAHARLVAGLCAGLLGVLLAHGLWYHFVDRQDLIREWDTNRQQLLQARNIEPGTFEYTQFKNKILRGELMGFSASPNTYAAELVLLGMVVLGAAAQFVRDGRWVAAGAMLILSVTAAAVLPLAQSRTATLTGALGVLLVAAAVPLGRLLGRRATLLYLLGAVAVLGVVAFVVGYGLSRGTLFQDSLNFRWRYWVGSFSLWQLHPLLGTGWENFGHHYLGVRLPEATEEIKDPHNYLVRFFVELGTVGGLLALAWTARTWWEITRPITEERDPEEHTNDAAPVSRSLEERRSGTERRAPAAEQHHSRPGDPHPPAPVRWAVAAIAVGFVLNVFAAVDTSQDAGYVAFEAVRRGGLLALCLALAAAAWLTLVRRGREPVVEFVASPAPLVGVGLVVGLGMFFVHNLVDFAVFETGATFLFALLLGAAVGLRVPAAEPRPAGRRAARWGTAVAGAAWLLGLVLVAVPIASSEAVAREADASLRANRPAVAARGYESAFANTVRNADYADRSARAWRWAGDAGRAQAMADQAVAASPFDAGLRVARAELAVASAPPDPERAAGDYRDAVRLDPNNFAIRRRYAQLLAQLGRPREAAAELRAVLALNDRIIERLTERERERLSDQAVAEIRQEIARLER